MRHLRNILAISVCLATSVVAAAQNLSQSKPTPIGIQPVIKLRARVEAWPLIAAPKTDAERRINATLRLLNRKLAHSLRECDESARQSYLDENDSPKKPARARGAWERKVRITMRGPVLLSMVANDEEFCGGAHPDGDTTAMVFDLETGQRVNWQNYFSEPLDGHSDNMSDGGLETGLVIPALREMSLLSAVPECRSAFVEGQSYSIWPDANKGVLIAVPFDLPHVVAACADPISLTSEQALKLGFTEPLVGAIQQAHLAFITQHKR
jgi:hypothetical protein